MVSSGSRSRIPTRRGRGRRSAAARVLVPATLAAVVAGCPPRVAERIRLDAIPMHEAIAIVNANSGAIRGTLRASGTVNGYFTNRDGRRTSYHLDGIMFYLAPTYFRFDLKKFGDRQILFGANRDDFWFFNKQDESYYCGRQGSREDLPPEVPVRPDQLVDALGLTPIPDEVSRDGDLRRAQRVVEDYQQILFLRADESGRVIVEKEYWLDRAPPRLIRRVVLRDNEGVLEMESSLDEYKPLAPAGPLLPHRMVADWPTVGAHLRFHVGQWTSAEQVTPGGPQFSPPVECRANRIEGSR